MSEDNGINKSYVERYMNVAESTDNEDLKLDALYRFICHINKTTTAVD